MQATRIDLEDYVLSGGGANGESYFKKNDPSVLLKLYFPGKETQPLDELLLSRKVFEAGIPVPEPGKYVVTGDGRYGILFKRIHGKVSYTSAVGNNPGKVREYAYEFAAMCRKLHATKVDTAVFESVKDRYLGILKGNVFFTDAQKEKIGEFIIKAPDADTAIHGDLQFGNAIFTEDRQYFIDLGDFCYGHPYFDLGMVYLTCKLGDEEFTSEVFHMDKGTAARFWDAFAKGYFGEDVPLVEIENEILPYAGLKTLIIERDTGYPFPRYRKVLEQTIL